MSHTTPDPPSSNNPNRSSLDEVDLVVQAQTGDQAAFEVLYGRYSSRICLYLTRMVGNDAVGSDLTQDTFLKAWESLLTLREPSHFVAWLYRIATNMAYNHQKRAKLLHFISWDMYRQGADEPSVEGPEEMFGEIELIRQALAHVSITYRPCLILYIVEELSQREIAEILGMKEANVSKYVSRGKADLRQIYLRLVNEKSSVKERRDR